MRVLRDYCRADGEGVRLRAQSWARVAALVAWPLEPAWDRLVLISGMQLSTPRGSADRVEVDVEYSVVGEIHPGRIRTVARIDRVTYALARDLRTDSWRVLGPPHPPHVFDNNVERHAMANLLAPESAEYRSASALVWETLRRRGAAVAYAEVTELALSPDLADTPRPEVGDVALYYAGATPYHAGIVDADAMVISATLNAGIVRLPSEAFPGEIRYRRISPSSKSQLPNPKSDQPAPAADE